MHMCRYMKKLTIADMLPLNLETGTDVSCVVDITMNISFLECFCRLFTDRPIHLQILRHDIGVLGLGEDAFNTFFDIVRVKPFIITNIINA